MSNQHCQPKTTQKLTALLLLLAGYIDNDERRGEEQAFRGSRKRPELLASSNSKFTPNAEILRAVERSPADTLHLQPHPSYLLSTYPLIPLSPSSLRSLLLPLIPLPDSTLLSVAQRMEKPTITIHSIPLEVFSIIFENVCGTPADLLRFALVHTSWTSPALDLLYRRLEIDSEAKATTFSGQAYKLYLEKTKVLIMSDFAWIPVLEVVLLACQNLRKLCLNATVSEVPLNVLQYASLKS